MMLHIFIALLLLSLLCLEVNSVLLPYSKFNMEKAVTLADNLVKIHSRLSHDNSDITSILKKMSVETSTLLYESADSITKLPATDETLSFPSGFHPPDDIKNNLKEIEMAIKRVNRLFRPFLHQYLNQNISMISLTAIMVKALDADPNSSQNSMQKIFQVIHPRINNNDGFFSRMIQYINTDLFSFCFFVNPREYMITLYQSIVTMELRMFVTSIFAHKLQSILSNGNYIKNLEQIRNEYLQRRHYYMQELQQALSQESNEFFNCGPIYDPDYTADQVFAVNLLLKESDYQNNWVVTGVKLVVRNKILHLQLEEGKLMPGGHIEPASERWIPVDDINYDSGTLNQSNVEIPIHDDVESHYIGLWDYLHYSTLKAPENFVVVGAKFEIYYLYPEDYLNKTIIYLRVKYAEMIPITGQIVSSNVKFSDMLTDENLELKRQFQQFKKGTDRDKQNVNIGYAGYRIEESGNILTHIDARPIYLPSRTPLSGIGLYENHVFFNTKAASLKIFIFNATPFFEAFGMFLYHQENEREKAFTCNL